MKRKSATRKVLVIDDSLMLLSFVKEILAEAHYEVTTAATAEEGLNAATNDLPDLILLDYVLPDMKGDEVCRRLLDKAATASVPIVYMSGFGTDLQPDQMTSPSVIRSLNKPFTSDLLMKTVENYMPKDPNEPAEPQSEFTESEPAAPVEEPAWTAPVWAQEETAAQPEANQPIWPEPGDQPSAAPAETAEIASAAGATSDAWWSAPVTGSSWESPAASEPTSFQSPTEPGATEGRLPMSGASFSGDARFCALNGAVPTIGRETFTGTRRRSGTR